MTWNPDYTLTPKRVVCAAICKDDHIITGARHYDKVMRQQIEQYPKDFWKAGVRQGFIDQFGNFMDRTEAWKVATDQGQIRREVSTPGTLYSENLY